MQQLRGTDLPLGDRMILEEFFSALNPVGNVEDEIFNLVSAKPIVIHNLVRQIELQEYWATGPQLV